MTRIFRRDVAVVQVRATLALLISGDRGKRDASLGQQNMIRMVTLGRARAVYGRTNRRFLRECLLS
ncbi:hypothetical protein [Streptomyces phaeochromogenes]|uniref:hypothetical protein n=1 Tax=Streptomyces phaeochromogenes TaxID=1923 RepID=UPI0036977138